MLPASRRNASTPTPRRCVLKRYRARKVTSGRSRLAARRSGLGKRKYIGKEALIERGPQLAASFIEKTSRSSFDEAGKRAPRQSKHSVADEDYRHKSKCRIFNHFSFVSFAEGSFPLVAVFSAPMPIGLSQLPIGANHFVTVTKDLSAAKFAAEIKRNLFKFGLRRFMKERRLPERIQLFCRPF